VSGGVRRRAVQEKVVHRGCLGRLSARAQIRRYAPEGTGSGEAQAKEGVETQAAGKATCRALKCAPSGRRLDAHLPTITGRPTRGTKRIGQSRQTVDMLNLGYHETQDEKVYQVLSRRMKDRYDIFGGLPDTIEDD
jgi:hypothetical protein